MTLPRILPALIALATGCFNTVRPHAEIDSLPAPGAFPHELLEGVLQKYVDDRGLVDYKGIQQDRATLDQYTSYVAAASPKNHPELFPTKSDQLAYWINAYNAFAITGVIDRPGLTSVNESKSVLTAFFFLTKYVIGGDKIALYNLENGIVRPEFKDPRVHFALNCDSAGCPRLPNTAFHPATLEAELDAAAHEFCTDPRKVRPSEDGKKIQVSQIFEWYAPDFVESGGPIKFVNKYGGAVAEDAQVEFIPYDWALVAQPGRGP